MSEMCLMFLPITNLSVQLSLPAGEKGIFCMTFLSFVVVAVHIYAEKVFFFKHAPSSETDRIKTEDGRFVQSLKEVFNCRLRQHKNDPTQLWRSPVRHSSGSVDLYRSALIN